MKIQMNNGKEAAAGDVHVPVSAKAGSPIADFELLSEVADAMVAVGEALEATLHDRRHAFIDAMIEGLNRLR